MSSNSTKGEGKNLSVKSKLDPSFLPSWSGDGDSTDTANQTNVSTSQHVEHAIASDQNYFSSSSEDEGESIENDVQDQKKSLNDNDAKQEHLVSQEKDIEKDPGSEKSQKSDEETGSRSDGSYISGSNSGSEYDDDSETHSEDDYSGSDDSEYDSATNSDSYTVETDSTVDTNNVSTNDKLKHNDRNTIGNTLNAGNQVEGILSMMKQTELQLNEQFERRKQRQAARQQQEQLEHQHQDNLAEHHGFVEKAESIVLGEIMEQSEVASLTNEYGDNGTNSTTNKDNKRYDIYPQTRPKHSDTTTKNKNTHTNNTSSSRKQNTSSLPNDEDISGSSILPEVLQTMRQKIEALALFDSDNNNTSSIMNESSTSLNSSLMMIPQKNNVDEEKAKLIAKENLRKTFTQSISPTILVNLSHKRYERRRNAAMEIERVVRSLVLENELERVWAILLFLSDDYVRSTSEDARKGGVVSLAACAIGLKKTKDDKAPNVTKCKDIILASVIHACQDHNQRVRYYATESLFNVVKVLNGLAVKHFFILYEILRSLYADVDLDVRSGAQLLDKKLKEVVVAAINNGSLTLDACIPLFTRFVHMKNKATKRLTLTWLQEFSEKLVGSPLVEFLHLILGGIFTMLADPNASIRQGSLQFLETVLPQLLGSNDDFESGSTLSIDFDKILQNLVTAMEHPDPFVRKVAMYWMSQIVQTHLAVDFEKDSSSGGGVKETIASISIRNSLPHVLPGILLSIGDQFNGRYTNKDLFLPDLTTRSLAEKTNTCLQNAVRRNGKAYAPHLDGFIVALREELDCKLSNRNPPGIERKPYRLDVRSDGTGIESAGWFRTGIENGDSDDSDHSDDALMMSRLCALQWIVVLYDSVVPNTLMSEYAREFISPILHQLVENPPERIIFKSFEVLARITVPIKDKLSSSVDSSKKDQPRWSSETSTSSTKHSNDNSTSSSTSCEVMNDHNVQSVLNIIDPQRKKLISRDREVFAVLVHIYSHHQRLIADIPYIITFMCTLQPAEFIFISFSMELHKFLSYSWDQTIQSEQNSSSPMTSITAKEKQEKFSRDLEYVSSFVGLMNHVLLTASETKDFRNTLLNSVGNYETHPDEKSTMRLGLFHILLTCFSHNLNATFSLCLWSGAFATLTNILKNIDPLDINLLFYLELDQLIEMLERPIFRHLHLRMLEHDEDIWSEGSSFNLFRALKSLLMLLPQTNTYSILKNRLLSITRFRQSVVYDRVKMKRSICGTKTEQFVEKVKTTRKMYCDEKWRAIRVESLEVEIPKVTTDAEQTRREWLGYNNKEEEEETKKSIKRNILLKGPSGSEGYNEFHGMNDSKNGEPDLDDEQAKWKEYWAQKVSDE